MAEGELVTLLSELVAIESVNPDLVPGGAGEAEIAAFVARWLERAGLEVAVEEARPARPNVVARARGTGNGRWLLLNAHMDTVGLAGMEQPLEPRVEGDRLYGRGAYDMKASLAGIMLVGAAATDRALAGDVVVTAVSDEELGSVGTEALAASHSADAAVVAEPTELRVAVAHKGFAGFEIETHGRAAHGSRPDLGVDAIRKMAPILDRLDELDGDLQRRRPHPLLGTGSLHASLIEGGQELSTYPERCVVTGERRTIPGETVEQVERELRDAAGGDADVRMLIAREPFEVDKDEEIVRLVSERSGAEVCGVPFWADSAILAAAGIPTVLFGPVGEGAHADVEWVDLPSVERLRDILLEVAEAFCAAPA